MNRPEERDEMIDEREDQNVDEDEKSVNKPEMKMKARNNRMPNQANHGARPCSSVMRRMKMKNILRRGNTEVKDDDGQESNNMDADDIRFGGAKDRYSLRKDHKI
eukprot:CAMPEP_0170528022 /NCGR_PEP_ID=MMETSP0209-20121228/13521_1 /TAXON_ID=665100 ORGANISM="Litonotus pictus, Strain P1" /NCGR_SAMPLE_ID=MMETSP0209 /ASSEMBLY_ACC=CAM_ASM_000301 /LENGTH=104 /DNA_ID=CAMNT_0010818979 /DNA_START=268 /DNA_END=582 /DNA_ORIENTATION=+